MEADPQLIDRIYEAGAQPQLWPAVLSALGRACGAAGGLFFLQSASGLSWMAAPEVSWIIEAYIEQGWMTDNTRGAPMIAELYPGFRTDSDYRTAKERAALPVYRDFLIPHGIDAAAGSVFQGVNDDAIILTLEHFGSHAQSIAAIPLLNTLRPHLGRALSLSSRLGAQVAAGAVALLERTGVAAAVVSGDGKLRAANDRFVDRLGNGMSDGQNRLRFADRFLQAQLSEALAAIGLGAAVRSVVLRPGDDRPAAVIHMVPLKRSARDVFGWDGVLLLLAEAANASIPGADLLRLLFDLTPAEARVARHILEGGTAKRAAARLGVREATVRVHLKAVFAKTGVARQSDLIRLLAMLGPPPGDRS